MDLRGANLNLVDFRGATINPGTLMEARSERVAELVNEGTEEKNFRDADLSYAYLAGMDLRGAILSGANLEGANLEGADLTGARLVDTNLRDANIENAILENVFFCRTIMPDGKVTPCDRR